MNKETTMAGEAENKLAELGITLPEAAAPVANYVPYVKTGKLLFISGQIPIRGGALIASGKVKPLMDSRFPLHEAAEAHRRMETSHHIGKIVLLV